MTFRRSRFGLEELGRIQRNPVESHFEVQVGTGRPTRTADPADQLATEHSITSGGVHLVLVGIQRRVPTAVADHHRVAVAIAPAGRQHNTVGGGNDRVTRIAVEIEPFVGPDGAEDRMHSITERAGHDPRNRPVGDHELGAGDIGIVGAIGVRAVIVWRIARVRVITGAVVLRNVVLGLASRFLFREALRLFLGEPLRLFFREAPGLFLGGDPAGFLFEPQDLLRHLAIGFCNLVADLLPLGNPDLHLHPQILGLNPRAIEFGQPLLEFDPSCLCFGLEVPRQTLGGLLFSDPSSELVDKFVLVPDDLVEERTPKGALGQIDGVELIETVRARRNKGLDRSLLEPDTHQFDLGLEDRSILASLDDLRFRRVDIGEHTGDPGLLERNMSVDGGKGINQLGVLCTQGIEFCGRFGGVGAARFALGP